MAFWYVNAKPGPRQACTTTVGTPPVWDNDSTYNLSLPVDDTWSEVTPENRSYTCQVHDAQNNLLGELSWNHSTHVLKIFGTIFLDGDFRFDDNGQIAHYQGRGIIYAARDIEFDEQVCAGGTGLQSCVTDGMSNWDPSVNMMTVLAGDDSEFDQGTGQAQATPSALQGIIYAVDECLVHENFHLSGPIICDEIQLPEERDRLADVPHVAAARVARRRPGVRLAQRRRRLRGDGGRPVGMSFAVAAAAFAPGLAIGSFLNVVAARVPLKRSIVSPASACMSCGRELAWHENIPVFSYLVLRGRCKGCGTKIGVVYPVVELVTALLIAGSFLAFGFSGKAFVASLFCATLVVISATDLSHRIVPNVIVLPVAAIVLVAMTRSGTERGMGARRLRSLVLPLSRRARLSEGHGHGRRQARAPARRDARPHGSGRADARHARGARALARPVRAARHGRAEDDDPVCAVPLARRHRRALLRRRDPRRVPEPLLAAPHARSRDSPRVRRWAPEGLRPHGTSGQVNDRACR